jgi:hypothetical protein
MAVSQFLGVGTVLEVFLQGVLADVGCGPDGGDGRFVDDFGAVFCGHICDCMVWDGILCSVWFGLECGAWFGE